MKNDNLKEAKAAKDTCAASAERELRRSTGDGDFRSPGVTRLRGETTAANCQMLCRTHNRAKGNS